MKNIHVIPTIKAIKNQKGIYIKGTSVNIYITNDEEIKEGDWILNETHNIEKAISHYNYKSLSSDCKKVILTTDTQLIKDGVQPIDDEFLEWFVKNPSCEEVEVQDINNKWHKEDETIISVSIYKIIIPKKEPNPFEIPKTLPDDVFYESLEPKQETLEEASLLSRPIHLIWDEGERYDCNEEFREEFKKGAKWKQEKIYNEIKELYDSENITGFSKLAYAKCLDIIKNK